MINSLIDYFCYTFSVKLCSPCSMCCIGIYSWCAFLPCLIVLTLLFSIWDKLHVVILRPLMLLVSSVLLLSVLSLFCFSSHATFPDFTLSDLLLSPSISLLAFPFSLYSQGCLYQIANLAYSLIYFMCGLNNYLFQKIPFFE